MTERAMREVAVLGAGGWGTALAVHIARLGTPVKLSHTPLTPGRPAPMLGQHTDEVLREIGLTTQDIAKVRGS